MARKRETVIPPPGTLYLNRFGFYEVQCARCTGRCLPTTRHPFLSMEQASIRALLQLDWQDVPGEGWVCRGHAESAAPGG